MKTNRHTCSDTYDNNANKLTTQCKNNSKQMQTCTRTQEQYEHTTLVLAALLNYRCRACPNISSRPDRDRAGQKVGQGDGLQWVHIFSKQNFDGYALASLHGRARPSSSMAAPHLPHRPKLLDLRLLSTRLAHGHPVQCWMPRHSENLPGAGSLRGGLGHVSRLLFNICLLYTSPSPRDS